jgi:hypothetical protein
MKCVFIFAILVLRTTRGDELSNRDSHQDDELSDRDRHRIALKCIGQVGIDERVVEEAIRGNIPENDIKYKNFLACSYKKQGYMNEDGIILIENVKKFLNRFYNISDLKVINVCSGRDGPNHSENAFKAMKCIFDQIKNLKVVNDE